MGYPGAVARVRHLLAMAAVLAATLLSGAAPAAAQEAPGDRDQLIQLDARTFDLGADVRWLRDYADESAFIPITEVRWIGDMTDADPILGPTVIHIKKAVMHPLAEPVWLPSEDRAQFAPADDLAEAWALEGYDVRWRRSTPPTNRGSILLFPEPPDAGFFVRCAYDRAYPGPTFCAIPALYPPDTGLRLYVRVYRRATDPLEDFRAIAERALSLVHCLDVTEELAAGTWQPLEVNEVQSLSDFLATCKDISS